MNESAGSRFIRKISGTLFVVALGFVMVAWVKVSQPFDPDQLRPASGKLDTAAIAAAQAMPNTQGSVVTLAYHGVSDTDHAGTTLSRELFAEHMHAMKAAGFQTVTLDQVQKLVNRESVTLPPKPMLLTFDGGHITDWTNVDPLLEELGYNAVTFLTTSEIVQPGTPSYYLSFDQLKKLRDTGRWEFGSHTHDAASSVDVPGDVGISFTNRVMVDGVAETPEQWDDRITKDLEKTQEFFRKNLGGPAKAFSYPNGDPRISNNLAQIQARTEKLLKSAGFDYAFYGEEVPSGQVDGVTKNSNRYRLARIGVRSTTTVATLLKDVRGTIPTAPPADLSTAVKWTGPYTVACQTLKHNLYVYSRDYGTCKLDTVNTTRWRDYSLSTTIKSPINRQIAFVSVRDGEGATHTGSLVVAIGRNQVVVRQTLHGGDESKDLAKRELSLSPTRDITIKVSGTGPDNKLVVSVTGMQPITVRFRPEINAGGVKFGVDGYVKPLTFFRPRLTSVQEATP